MAHQYLLNQSVAGGAYHTTFWNLMQTMIAAGWTKVKDSDGTTYSSSGTQITTLAGLAPNGAWFVMRDPAGVREICIQHDTAGNTNQWRIKYSKRARFVGGSPGAQRVPSATDEAVICGGGTDAAPTFTWFNAQANYNVHVVCCDASLGYAFWVLEADTASTAMCGVFMMDVLQGASPGDDDPTAFIFQRRSNCIGNMVGAGPAQSAYVADGGGAWIGNPAYETPAFLGFGLSYWGAVAAPGNAGANAWSGNDSAPWPVPWQRTGSGVQGGRGIKGFSMLMRYPSTGQTNLTTYSSTTGTSKDWVIVNNVLLLWPDPTTAPTNSPGNVTCDPAIPPSAYDYGTEMLACGQAEPIYAAAPPTRNPIPHYFLSALDNNGVVQKWVDTAVNMVNAPAVGAGYAVTEPKIIAVF